MKRILVLLLALALTVGLCACGAKDDAKESDPATEAGIVEETVDTAALSENVDKATAYIESVVDISKMTSLTDDQDTSVSKSWSYEEQPDGVDFPVEVTIDSKSIVIKETKVSEIEELGFEVELDAEHRTVEPNMTYSFNILKNDKSLIFDVDNSTDQPQSIDDMTVSGFQGNFNEYSLDFTYCGLNGTSTLKDVIDAIGAPNDLSLSADSSGTTISIGYLFEGIEGAYTASKNLTVDLSYNAADNTAAVSDISIQTVVYTDTVETAE